MSRRSVLSGIGESRGEVILEFAFVLPFLLLLLTGIFDFGFAFREYLLVTNAAREGARMAILPGYSDDDVKDRVGDYLTKAGGAKAASIEVATESRTSAAGGIYTVKMVTAQVDHAFTILAPFSPKYASVALKAVSVMRVEAAAEAP